MSNESIAVSYLRVSTVKGRSGLGIESQRASIREALDEKKIELVAEFTDIESGSKDARKGLEDAIDYAKKTGALLVIAKLDRVSRRVSFIASLMESGIKFAVADMPNATSFQLHIWAALAEEERRLISVRTKSALQAAKQRGTILGKTGVMLAKKNKAAAINFAHSVKDKLLELRNSGHSFKEVADELNNQGIPSFTGGSGIPRR